MKITIITEENIAAFYGLLGRFWDERQEDGLFIGGMMEDEPVAACAAAVLGTELSIRFFAVAPDWQGEGIGEDFMTEIAAYAFSMGVNRISSYYYEEDESGWDGFLSACGFTMETSGLTRRTYAIEDIMNVRGGNMTGVLPESYRVASPEKLSLREKESLRKVLDTAARRGQIADPGELFDAKNTCGGVLYQNEELRAAVSCTREEKELVFGTILLRVKNREEIDFLMDHIILSAMEQRNQPEYISCEFADTESDESLLRFIEKAGIEPCDEAVCRIGFLDREVL